jgi:hypothetical protein
MPYILIFGFITFTVYNSIKGFIVSTPQTPLITPKQSPKPLLSIVDFSDIIFIITGTPKNHTWVFRDFLENMDDR